MYIYIYMSINNIYMWLQIHVSTSTNTSSLAWLFQASGALALLALHLIHEFMVASVGICREIATDYTSTS